MADKSEILLGSRGGVTQVRVEFMDDQTRSIIRNVKGPGTHAEPLWRREKLVVQMDVPKCGQSGSTNMNFLRNTVRENDILCLLESEREARRLR